jgi:hypothetical protein
VIKRTNIANSYEPINSLLKRLGFPIEVYGSAESKVTVTVIQLWSTYPDEFVGHLSGCNKPGNYKSVFRHGIPDYPDVSKVSDGLVGYEEYTLKDGVIVSRRDVDVEWAPSKLPFRDLFRNDWWLPCLDDVLVKDLSSRICDLEFDQIDEEYCMDGTGETKAEWLVGRLMDVEVV